MDDPRQLPQPPNPPRFRFSLAGLFVVVFGLGVGLARLNAIPRDWPGALMAAAGSWFIIAKLHEVWRLRLHRKTSPFSHSGHCAVLIFVSALMAFVLALSAAEHWFDPDEASSDYIPAFEFVHSMTYLTLVMVFGNWSYARELPARQRLISSFAALVGLLWLALVCVDLMMIPVLVHLAITGVYQAMPLRWVEIAPDTYRHSLSEFISGAFLTAAVAIFSACCMSGLSARWERGVHSRIAWLTACSIGLIFTVLLIVWGYTLARFVVSPHLTENLFGQTSFELAIGVVLWLSATTMIALRTSAMRDANSGATVERSTQYGGTQPLVIGFLLFATVMQLVIDIRTDQLSAGVSLWLYARAFLPLKLIWPFFILNVGAILVLGRALWLSCRSQSQIISYYDKWKFITMWLVAFVAIPVFVCAAAWFGFVLPLIVY